MQFSDADTPAALNTHISPWRHTKQVDEQAIIIHTLKQVIVIIDAVHIHTLTCTVQAAESCWTASLQGILGCLLRQRLIGRRSHLCCGLIGGRCLRCVVVGDCRGLQTCRQDAEEVKAHRWTSLERHSLARCWCSNCAVTVKRATGGPWATHKHLPVSPSMHRNGNQVVCVLKASPLTAPCYRWMGSCRVVHTFNTRSHSVWCTATHWKRTLPAFTHFIFTKIRH